MYQRASLPTLLLAGIGLVLALLTANACSSTAKNSGTAAGANDSSSCTANGEGSWANGVCTCAPGWVLSALTGTCQSESVAGTSTSTIATACSTSGGSWSGVACTCPAGEAESATGACAAATTAAAATVTQTQCQTAAATGAVWNGEACLCQTAAEPYWDPNALQCSATPQTTTSGVGATTQQQCLSAATTGAAWNGTTCQCTSATYPYWNASTASCGATSAGTTAVATDAQCVAAAQTGAEWNGSTCVCTNAAAPYWDPSVNACDDNAAAAGTGTNGCPAGEINNGVQCVATGAASGGACSGGQLEGTLCLCPSGTLFNVQTGGCVSFQNLGGNLQQNVCVASGGQVEGFNGQCACPGGTETVVERNQGLEFCAQQGFNGNGNGGGNNGGGLIQSILNTFL